MPNVEHSKPLKMATAALSKIVGVRAAAKVAGVDWRTADRWVKGSQDGDEAEWTAARELAQARHLEALIRGDTRGATQWATSAGISARNQRYAQLIARREQRRAEQDEGGQPEAQTDQAWRAELNALPDDVTRLIAAEIDLELQRRGSAEAEVYDQIDALPEEEGEQGFREYVRELAKLPAEEIATRREEAEQKLKDLTLNPPEPVAAPPEPPQPPPTPPSPSYALQEPSEPPYPGLRVVRADEADDYDGNEHLWRPYWP